MKDEIARSCALIGEKVAATTPACGLAPLDPVSVLLRYYEALDERDFNTAFAMLKADGGKQKDFAAFRAGFEHTTSTRATAGKPSGIEGAAGSSFVTVPVVVVATLDHGRQQRFVGSYVLRAVNAQGPTADTRWFIFSSDLHSTTE